MPLGLALLYRYYPLTWRILWLTFYYCYCSCFFNKNKIMGSFMLIYFILRLKNYIYNILLEIHLASSGKSCCFLCLFLYCYGKMQFFIHCNVFCQKYKFIYLLYLQLIFLENTYYYKSVIFFHGHWEAIYFFHGEEIIKSNHNNLSLFNYWPCS